MAWRRPGDKPLSEPMLISLPTYIYVTRPQWGITSRDELKPDNKYMHQLNDGHSTTLISVIACRRFCAKWSSKPREIYCRLHPRKSDSMKLESISNQVDFEIPSAPWQPSEANLNVFRMSFDNVGETCTVIYIIHNECDAFAVSHQLACKMRI